MSIGSARCRQGGGGTFTSVAIARRRRIGHLAGLGLFLTIVVLWVVSSFSHPDVLDRDWVAFDNAGWRALGGGWSSVYTASAAENWPYLYPPYALLLCLPLGLLPYWPSYLLTVGMAVGGLAWSCRRLAAVADEGDGRFLVFVSMLLCAPTTAQVLITGQYSWLYLMALVGTAAFWEQGDERRAGWCLALLAVKPNLAVVLLALIVVRRGGAIVRKAGEVVLGAVVLTLLLSMAAWWRFFEAAGEVVARQENGAAPMEKQITVLAFLRVLDGRGEGRTTTSVLWFVLSASIGVLTLWAWRRADSGTPALRLVGMAALAMVALSPRLYFYDGLIVAVPGATWYLRRDGYTLQWVRRVEGLCLFGIGVVTALFFPWPAACTMFGPLAGLWLVLEVVDVDAGVRSRTSPMPFEWCPRR